MATIVLVHGAHVGGWAWRDVARLLRAMGHEVYTPTLTGLGERVHLGRPDTDVETHVQDIINVLFYEDVHDVVLVSWSYSGMVVAVVADRVPERLRQVIHVDGTVPEDGQSMFDLDPTSRAYREERARLEGDGWRVGVGDLAVFEERMRPILVDDARRRWFIDRFGFHPLRTFSQSIRLSQRNPPGVKQTFVRCSRDTIWPHVFDPIVARLQALPDWDVQELPVTHFGPFAEPDVVARVLHELAR